MQNESAGNEPRQLRRFLLDQLPDQQREPLEEQLLQDDELFEELLAAEADLVDDAISDALSPGEQQHLTALPDQEQRLAFARALRTVIAERAPQTGHRASLRWRRWSPWLAAAAAVVLAVSAWLGWQPGQQTSGETVSFVLPSSGLRGPARELPIATGVDRIVLLLELPVGSAASTWQVVVTDPHGGEVARWRGITATGHDWGTAVQTELPAAGLVSGSYTISLQGDDGSGEALLYRLTVVRPDQPGEPVS